MNTETKISFSHKIYSIIVNPKLIKIIGYCLIVLYFGFLIIGAIIAEFFGPEGYSIMTHYISDLGSWNYTPAPYLYDIACICAGILTIPFTFYLEKFIAPLPNTQEDVNLQHRWIYRFMGANFFLSMFGSFFYVGVGIFSEDRDLMGMHGICSYGAFGGFSLSAIFLGFAIIFAKQEIVPKPFNFILGLIGIFLPFTVAIYNILYGGPFLEWLLLISILIWLVPILLFAIIHANKQIKKNIQKD
ncbi:MAG: DUF998 domain-containing protein [Candidatus Helarchaeota archaeon]